MQAEEIVRQLEAAGLETNDPDEYLRPDGMWFAVGINGPIEQWTALLSTDEERLALLALRAGVTVFHWGEEGYYPVHQIEDEVRRAAGSLGVYWPTAIAAIAAAGRVLEEEEKRQLPPAKAGRLAGAGTPDDKPVD